MAWFERAGKVYKRRYKASTRHFLSEREKRNIYQGGHFCTSRRRGNIYQGSSSYLTQADAIVKGDIGTRSSVSKPSLVSLYLFMVCFHFKELLAELPSAKSSLRRDLPAVLPAELHAELHAKLPVTLPAMLTAELPEELPHR